MDDVDACTLLTHPVHAVSQLLYVQVFIHRRLNADGSAVGPPSLNILPSDSITYDDEPQPADAQAGSDEEVSTVLVDD